MLRITILYMFSIDQAFCESFYLLYHYVWGNQSERKGLNRQYFHLFTAFLSEKISVE